MNTITSIAQAVKSATRSSRPFADARRRRARSLKFKELCRLSLKWQAAHMLTQDPGSRQAR
jgi:hypothetical protein